MRLKWIPLIVLLILSIFLTGCSQEKEMGTLTVGVIVPETGLFSPAGKAMKNAAYLAEEHIKKYGISEFEVKIVVADGGSTPEQAKSAFMELAKQADIIVGAYSSDQSVVCAEAAKDTGKIYIASVASTSQLEKAVREGNRFVFRNAYNTSYWGVLAGEFLELSGARKYYFVGYDPLRTFNQGMLKSFEGKTNAVKIGEVYYRSTRASPNDYAIKAEEVARTADSETAVILGDPGATAIQFVKTYRKAGGEGLVYSVGGVLALPKTLMTIKVNHIAFQSAALENTEKTRFTGAYFEDYREKYGEEANNYAGILTYDAVLIAAQAWRGDTESTIQALESEEFEGAAGIYRFNSEHQALWGSEKLRGIIAEYFDGKIEILYPEEFKTSDAVWP